MKHSNHQTKILIPIVIFLVLSLFIPDRVFAQPANDACASAVTIVSGTSCTTTAGQLRLSGVNGTATAGISAFCGAAANVDVWYKFVAASTLPTIQLSNMPLAGMGLNPRLQLFNVNSCTVATLNANSNNCVSGTNTATLNLTPSTALTIGSTYMIRVFSTTTPAAPSTDWIFDICVVDPSPPATNDLCGSATTLVSGPTCVNTAGTLTGTTYTSVTGACGAGTPAGNRNDVWYNFVAKSSNPTITLGSAPLQRSIQLFSGTCGSPSSVQCAVNSTTLTASALTVGSTYYVRIWSDNNTTGTFNICITDPVPANDLCSGATALTPALTCNNTAGNFYATSVSAAPTISGSCAGVVVNDMWYTFVAPSPNATIDLSSIGSSITNPGLELMSGDCVTMYSLACGTTSLSASGLITGNTYYIRAYSTGIAPTSTANAGFNICVTYTAPPAPPNDNCAGAISLPVNGSCNNTVGTVNSATASTGLPAGCGGVAAYDVWYKFTAITSTTTTITISSFGTGFAATRGIELYSGTCGSLTSVACNATSIAMALTIGTTYYVRVYSNTGPAPTTAGDFKICISTTSPPPRIGNSYVNITKNTVGGVVQNGDILEIRMTVWVASGTTLYKTRYLDNIPTKTSMLATSSDSIRVITNEGLTYRRYTATNNVNDDAGTYISAPGAGAYNIRLNLGQTPGNMPAAPAANTVADITGVGNLPGTGNPRGGGGLLFATSFRVQVTGSIGDTITLNGGQFIYRTSAASVTDVFLTGTPYQILITNPLTLCSNSIGINNASEFGGTFGSGTSLNRTADLSFPIAGYSFVAASNAQAIGDGQYAVVNNSSPISGTNQNAFRKPTCPTPAAPPLLCTNRMFGGYWYIDGDHSGTNNAAGNLPAASGSTGGYMLAVNADYVASEAYRQTLSGLCPNTYYEFSAWLQNICPTCGADSTGAQFAGTVTAPANGYPGVYPNLSFQLDGLDRYSTGQIDTVGWIKKGFVFLTGPTQTTATLSIRNNSQGGGGNDWVMDDISIATCFPSMSYSPTATPVVCKNNTITIGDTVRSQFSNYTYFVWQRSIDNGATWTDITTTQTATPTFNGSQWQYITSYNVPTSATNPADSGDIYRVYTATTPANITSPNCIANDGSAPITLSVLDCGIALKTDLLSFNGSLANHYAVLSWSTSKEDDPIHFELQRSDDKVTFTTIASVKGKNNGLTANYYSFTDPNTVLDKKWYRLILINSKGDKMFSHIIQLSTAPAEFEVDNIINPFSSQIIFNITLSRTSKVNVELIDMQGKVVKSNSYLAYAGVNSLRIVDTDLLSSGIYTLRVENNGKTISKKIMKKTN